MGRSAFFCVREVVAVGEETARTVQLHGCNGEQSQQILMQIVAYHQIGFGGEQLDVGWRRNVDEIQGRLGQCQYRQEAMSPRDGVRMTEIYQLDVLVGQDVTQGGRLRVGDQERHIHRRRSQSIVGFTRWQFQEGRVAVVDAGIA